MRITLYLKNGIYCNSHVNSKFQTIEEISLSDILIEQNTIFWGNLLATINGDTDSMTQTEVLRSEMFSLWTSQNNTANSRNKHIYPHTQIEWYNESWMFSHFYWKPFPRFGPYQWTSYVCSTLQVGLVLPTHRSIKMPDSTWSAFNWRFFPTYEVSCIYIGASYLYNLSKFLSLVWGQILKIIKMGKWAFQKGSLFGYSGNLNFGTHSSFIIVHRWEKNTFCTPTPKGR